MAGLNEVAGLELIERISKESFLRKQHSSRVWSNEMNCWGFFGSVPNDYDRTLIIGCAAKGDMIRPYGGSVWRSIGKGSWSLYEPSSILPKELGIVFSKSVDEKNGVSIIKLSFLMGGNDVGICDIIVPQSIAYRTMWELISK